MPEAGPFAEYEAQKKGLGKPSSFKGIQVKVAGEQPKFSNPQFSNTPTPQTMGPIAPTGMQAVSPQPQLAPQFQQPAPQQAGPTAPQGMQAVPEQQPGPFAGQQFGPTAPTGIQAVPQTQPGQPKNFYDDYSFEQKHGFKAPTTPEEREMLEPKQKATFDLQNKDKYIVNGLRKQYNLTPEKASDEDLLNEYKNQFREQYQKFVQPEMDIVGDNKLGLVKGIIASPVKVVAGAFQDAERVGRGINTLLRGGKSDDEIKQEVEKGFATEGGKKTMLNQAAELKFFGENGFVPDLQSDGITPTGKVNHQKSLQHLNNLLKDGTINKNERNVASKKLNEITGKGYDAVDEIMSKKYINTRNTAESDMQQYLGQVKGKLGEQKRDLTGETRTEGGLDVFAGATGLIAKAVAPGVSAGFTAAGETDTGNTVLGKLGEGAEGLGGFVNQLRGVSDLRENLPPEKQKEFDREVGMAISGLILGTKGKKNAVMNPKKFLKENFTLGAMDKNFMENVVGITKGAGKVAGGVAKVGGDVGEFALNQVTGLEKGTRDFAIKNPKLLSDMQDGKITPESKALDISNSINNKINELSSTGKGYKGLRESGKTVNTKQVSNNIDNALTKNKISVNNGKLKFDDLAPFNPTHQKAIQNAYNIIDTLKKRGKVGVDTILDVRKKIDNTINREGKGFKKDSLDIATEKLIKDMRKEVDDVAKTQVEGLKQLDEQFSSQIKEINPIKKDRFTKDGVLKDNALSKVKNLTNSANASKLARLEKVIPGIGKELEGLKAVTDINRAMANKVGTYARGSLMGGAGLASVLNPAVGIPMLIGAVATSPKVVIGALKKYGEFKQGLKSIFKKVDDGGTLSKTEAKTLHAEMVKKPEIIKEIAKVQKTMPFKGELPKTKPLSTKGLKNDVASNKLNNNSTSKPLQVKTKAKTKLEPKTKTTTKTPMEVQKTKIKEEIKLEPVKKTPLKPKQQVSDKFSNKELFGDKAIEGQKYWDNVDAFESKGLDIKIPKKIQQLKNTFDNLKKDAMKTTSPSIKKDYMKAMNEIKDDIIKEGYDPVTLKPKGLKPKVASKRLKK